MSSIVQLAPPGGQQATGEGEGGTSNKLKTAMKTMEVGEEGIYEGEVEKVEKYNTEAEGG